KKYVKIINKKYIYMTLHRPFNVDNKDRLRFIIDFINKISEHYPIIIPLHPRTDKMLEQFDLKSNLSNSIILIESVSYLKSIAFIKNAKSVITDSGGIQEETTYLNIPCYTLRKNTERPITITNGTNMLIEPDKNALEAILSDSEKTCDAIELWDGKTSERIVDFICKEVF
ncbi:UDP-N-acetylglucosamine 2-epimerase, partial [candidate division WOR-3 bacterium]|nr:UDP-N-acetylglucosamine 2-epimerase [candidate division WOR-3 bacterium]